MSADKCFLCKKYRNSKNGVKFFTYCFPSCKEVYDKWLEVCKVSESEEKECRPRICHGCFKPDAFHTLKTNTKRPVLKKDSVPVPLPIQNTLPIQIPIPIPILKLNKRKSEGVSIK